ncbi:hypothetical protein NMY22_g16558 [Coprinellus aureogranulatus]|nr:hypothetical protein NMY22_g16558 [Coprinellus aureogranulatus]
MKRSLGQWYRKAIRAPLSNGVAQFPLFLADHPPPISHSSPQTVVRSPARYRMASSEETGRGTSMFAGSHHHSFNSPDFRVAGRDFINHTISPNFSPSITVNVTTSAPATSSAHYAGDGIDWRRPPDRPQHTTLSLDASANSPPQAPTGQPSAPRATNESAPRKVHVPWRLSKMLGSLRRLMNPKLTERSKRSRGRARGTPDNERSTSKTLRRTASWGSDASASSCGSDVTVSSIDEQEDWEMERPKMTTPDIYVSRMLKSGKGLACWEPRPRWKHNAGDCGTVPGDVGTFTSDGGFRKLFNLWDDDESVRKTAESSKDKTEYQLPPRNVILSQSSLMKGDTVVQGVTAKTLYGDDNKTIARFEFRCRAQQGALLAVTSPADLEELMDHTRLKEHIFQHAEHIYKHADTIYRLAEDESLYIITGCIKSDTWALAAFNDDATFLGDTITLKKVGRGYSAEDDLFVWTDRGTSEAHVGRSEDLGLKNQTLFLRGFKLAFSQQFLQRMRNGSPASPPSIDTAPGTSSSIGEVPRLLSPENRLESQSVPHASTGPSSDPHASADNGSLSSVRTNSTHDVQVRSMMSGQFVNPLESSHPCDIINQYILENTEADFALSHDDDWLFLLDDPLWDDLVCSDANRAISYLISVRKGVAFMANTEIKKGDSTVEDESYAREVWEGPVYFSRFYAMVDERRTDLGQPERVGGIPELGKLTSQYNPEQPLRAKLGVKPGDPVNLWSLPDTPHGERPPHSYPVLVWLAIHGSPDRRLTLGQIFSAIEERFEYYRNQPEGSWKVRIINDLSLSQCSGLRAMEGSYTSQPRSESGLQGYSHRGTRLGEYRPQ